MDQENIFVGTLNNIEKHLLPQFIGTIQSNLSTEWIQNQFLFLKDCKHQNPWAQLSAIRALKLYLILISMEYCPIVGNTLHRDTAYRRK